jgi:hypothetical protein
VPGLVVDVDLAAPPALSASEEQAAASLIEVGLGE